MSDPCCQEYSRECPLPSGVLTHECPLPLKARENDENVTSFRGMAFVASDMGWP